MTFYYDIPDEIICPYTFKIMIDPIICDDGFTYEKSAILQLRNSISPMTQQPLDKTNMISNHIIKERIIKYNQKLQEEYKRIQQEKNILKKYKRIKYKFLIYKWKMNN
jgi:hypothetical protein